VASEPIHTARVYRGAFWNLPCDGLVANKRSNVQHAPSTTQRLYCAVLDASCSTYDGLVHSGSLVCIGNVSRFPTSSAGLCSTAGRYGSPHVGLADKQASLLYSGCYSMARLSVR
jgi:hypothetical protein